MDAATKLKELIENAKAEAARQIRLADDLTEALRRATNGNATEPLIPLRVSSESKSTLKTAIDVLGEQSQPMHIIDLVNQVSKKRGKLTPRASLESVLVTAIKEKKFGLKRTAPGTYEVVKK